MVACINPIIIRLPDGIKSQYDLPEYQGIFDTDEISDRLILKVLPEDYNAAHPINNETKVGYAAPYTITTQSLYQLEAVDNDQRSDIKKFALNDLLAGDGNLAIYNIGEDETAPSYGAARYVRFASKPCSPTLIAIEDYHELDTWQDKQQGFTLRIGILTVESLKGSYRKEGTNNNYNRGIRIIFTQTYSKPILEL